MRALVSRNVTTECRVFVVVVVVVLFVFYGEGRSGGRGGGGAGGQKDRQTRETETGIFWTDGRTCGANGCVSCARVYLSFCILQVTYRNQPTHIWEGGKTPTYVNEITTKMHILGVVPFRSSPKRARVSYCPIKISVLFYLLCVLVFF